MRKTLSKKKYYFLMEFLVEENEGKPLVQEQLVFPDKKIVIEYLKNHLKEKRYTRITANSKNILMDIAVYKETQQRPNYWIQVKRVEYIDNNRSFQ